MDSTKEIQFKEQIKKSFSACRKDIESLQQLVYSQSHSISQLLEQAKLKDEKILSLEQSINQNQDKFNTLIQEISLLKNSLTNSNSSVDVRIDEVPQNITSNLKLPKKEEIKVEKDPYEALLQFKAKLNKREILKQKLLSMISNGGMVLSELKFLFVEHFKYCSKATFYNYLKELELSKQIRIERENSKNMIYISGNVSNISDSTEFELVHNF